MSRTRKTAIRWVSKLSIVLLLAAALTSCGGSKTVKIGFLGQLTGPDSYVGQAAKLALEDKVKEINAAGGIDGYKVVLVTYDTRSEPAEVIASAKRLIDQDKVAAIIGPEWSAGAIPLGPIAAAGKVPVVATTASNINVTVDESGKVSPYIFRACFIDPYQGFALADFAYKELGKRKAAFITDVTAAYSKGIEQYFTQHFKELGGEIVDSEGYQSNDTEFRAQISKVAQSGLDCLIVPTATYRDIGLIAKQAAALGLNVQFLGVDGWVADELLAMSGKELEGAYLSSGVSTESPEFQDYNAKFQAAHNMKMTVYGYYALDALAAVQYGIDASIKKTGKIDTTAIRDALENMKDVQAFTSKLTFEPTTHNPHNKPVVIMSIKDSKWHIEKTYAPEN
jgi:branched-chain amino acid transport system substrate-binding protein